ncbi:transporter, major facilitator family [Luminiphilus syltensis NOR5-1B]|uniref:Transporter, major facilitator family n=1 Tax=Luminiphilus syltensis NOR5-1B TaxID=565045 RepID=B8KUH0_9GAMM|nr:MFS transporter [Luminiphilus syltensis]EED36369.1 transporter, major facilitator family [Luminiphilus syltensis NOR5-1B]
MAGAHTRTIVHRKTEFDDWRSLSLGIYMALTGYSVMVGLPVISTQWVNSVGFTAVQVGRLTGADLYGLGLGAAISFFLVARFDRRYITLGAALVAITANLLCIVFPEYGVTLWLRLMAGVGAGVFTGIAIATIGGHSRPAFAFAIELFAFALYQAVEMKFLPMLSIAEIYTVLSLAFGLSLVFLPWLPRRPAAEPLDVEVDVEEERGEHHIEHKHVPAYIPWLAMIVILFTYINIGAYWTYIELATVGTAADPDWVADVLVYTSVTAVVGCYFGVLLSNRYGLSRPLLITLLCMTGVAAMLVLGITNVSIALSMFAFNIGWVLVDLYQAAILANIDRSGRFVALVPAAQGVGNGIGPNIAASVLAFGSGYNGVFIMCAIASAIAMLVYLYTYLILRKRLPALADAS